MHCCGPDSTAIHKRFGDHRRFGRWGQFAAFTGNAVVQRSISAVTVDQAISPMSAIGT
jgi:hypothetical protein